MSLRFYTVNNTSGIEAAAGVKGIVLRQGHFVDKLAARLSSLKGDDSGVGYRAVMSELFGSKMPAEVREEVDHYRCLANSKTASAFYLVNVVLRNNFSRFMQQRLQNDDRIQNSIVRSVYRYHYDYGVFQQSAYPWIESHACIATGREPSSVDIPGVYNPVRVEQALTLLSKSQSNEPQWRKVGQIVDRTFQVSTFGRVPRKKVNILYPLLYLGSRQLANLNTILSSLRAVSGLKGRGRISYIRGKVFDAENTDATLPALLSGGLTVDPAAFDKGKLFLPSSEQVYEPESNKALADFLWYCASRSASAQVLKMNGASKDQVRSHFSNVRDFCAGWSPKTRDVQFSLVSHYDGQIVEDVFNSSRENAESTICNNIIRFWNSNKEWVREMRRINGPPIQSAFTCSYMHI